METPRRKLGTNLGPAPAFGVFGPPPLQPAAQAEQPLELPAPPVEVAAAVQVSSVQLESPPRELRAAAPTAAVAPRPKAPSKVPSKPRAPSLPPAPRRPAPEPAAAPKRMHGTFSEPYQRKTDSAQTRQTTLTVDLELDDRFEEFFRRNRRHYRTRSSLWAAAMEHFLGAHES